MGLLNDICRDENIRLIGFTDQLGEMLTGLSNTVGSGQAIAQANEKYILFDKTAPIWEKKFTVAHEVAHHLLGHLRSDTTITHQDRENEANIFASVIVALLLFQKHNGFESLNEGAGNDGKKNNL